MGIKRLKIKFCFAFSTFTARHSLSTIISCGPAAIELNMITCDDLRCSAYGLVLMTSSHPEKIFSITALPRMRIAFIKQFYKLYLSQVDSNKCKSACLIIYLLLLTQTAPQMDPTDRSVNRKPIIKSSGAVKTCCTAAGVVTTNFLLNFAFFWTPYWRIHSETVRLHSSHPAAGHVFRGLDNHVNTTKLHS